MSIAQIFILLHKLLNFFFTNYIINYENYFQFSRMQKKHYRLLKFNSSNYRSKFYNDTLVLHRSWAESYESQT